jgi:hypothetical protein
MRAEPTNLPAEGRTKELGALRIGLLGGFSVSVGGARSMRVLGA